MQPGARRGATHPELLDALVHARPLRLARARVRVRVRVRIRARS